MGASYFYGGVSVFAVVITMLVFFLVAIALVFLQHAMMRMDLQS